MIEDTRKRVAQTKNGALFVGLLDISGYIDPDDLGTRIFEKPKEWFVQRRTQETIKNKRLDFTEDEYKRIVTVFRELGEKLISTADAIEAAK